MSWPRDTSYTPRRSGSGSRSRWRWTGPESMVQVKELRSSSVCSNEPLKPLRSDEQGPSCGGCVPLCPCASVLANDDFIVVEACFYYRSPVADHRLCQHLLAPDVGNAELGKAVADALTHSRELSPDEIERWFDPSALDENYRSWIEAMMRRYGYKTKRVLFRGMRNCHVERMEGRIRFRPSAHERLEGWGSIDEEDVVIPDNSPPEAIGAGLRLALSRCTG